MKETNELKNMIEKLGNHFGSRIQSLFYQLHALALTGQPCDITIINGKPHTDVKIKPDFVHALMYGAGEKKLAEMLSEMKLSSGVSIDINEIWTINPMPVNGFSKKELDSVNMAEAEEIAGANGETLREMIRNTYRCGTKDEEDYYLRRFIAS